jgi:hypothetical protein
MRHSQIYIGARPTPAPHQVADVTLFVEVDTTSFPHTIWLNMVAVH